MDYFCKALFVYILSIAALRYYSKGELLQRTAWAAKCKIFAIWPFEEKFADPWYRATYHSHQSHLSHWVLPQCQTPEAPFLLVHFLPQAHPPKMFRQLHCLCSVSHYLWGLLTSRP